MVMTGKEFDDFLRSNFGIIKNKEGGNVDYQLKNFTPIGGGSKTDKQCETNCLITLFELLGYTTGAEVGVFEGALSKRLCKGFKGTIYSIDPWQHFDKGVYSDGSTTNTTQEDLDKRYNDVVKLLSGYENSVIIRKTSIEALSDIDNESLDFVYIDANHSRDFIWHDIRGWWTKIKEGGIISGHDFVFATKILADFCYDKGIRQPYCDSGLMPVVLTPYGDSWIYWRDEDWFIYKGKK